MSEVYNFEAKVVKYGSGRLAIYIPKKYQKVLRKHYGKKVKVIVIVEDIDNIHPSE